MIMLLKVTHIHLTLTKRKIQLWLSIYILVSKNSFVHKNVVPTSLSFRGKEEAKHIFKTLSKLTQFG